MKKDSVQEIIDNATLPQETNKEVVDRLARLDALDYEQCREKEAKKHGFRVSVLDAEVQKKRHVSGVAEKVQSVGPQEADPWHEKVDGHELFNDLTSAFNQYLALQKYQAEALALWSIFSYCIEAGNIAPKLLIYSPEKRCGKTTLLDVLVNIIWKPLPASNISPAVIYRVIESIGGTIVIDEADTFIRNNPEINGIINSGHRKSMAFVLRCDGDDHEPRHFSTWAPNVIAMIGKPQDTIVDRSILIQMKRKKSGALVDRFIPHKAEPELKVLGRKIKRWCDDNFMALSNADPETPEGLNDRAADNWRPLLAIADLIGGACPEIARLAAITLAEDEQDEDNSSIGVMLLGDIKEIFEARKADRISTEDLLFDLHAMEERPWPEWNRGKAITSRQIARHLKPFNVAPDTIRIGYTTKKGYLLEWFGDAFDRYLANLSVTASQPAEIKADSDFSVRNTAHDVTDKNALKPAENRDCYGVTDEEYEERVAIIEHDAGLSRDEAELIAQRGVKNENSR